MAHFRDRAGRNSILNGTNFDDLIQGLDGNDVLRGFRGHDHIVGGAGQDFLWGGDGDDLLSGSRGSDTLFGDAGNDHMLGGDNNDKLVGGAGNDHLNGGSARDILWGGAGADTFVFDRPPGPFNSLLERDVVLDFDFGDRAVFNGFGNLTIASLNGTTERVLWNNKVVATFENLLPNEQLVVTEHVGNIWTIELAFV